MLRTELFKFFFSFLFSFPLVVVFEKDAGARSTGRELDAVRFFFPFFLFFALSALFLCF